MRDAGLLVWQAHDLVRNMVGPGVTTAEIDREVENLFDQHSAVGLFKGYPGKTPFPAVTCMSVNREVVHGIPSSRPLEEGDILSVDTGCRINGWCGDSAWTYPVGEIAESASRLLDVTEKSLEIAIREFGVATKWSEVATKISSYVRDKGFSIVEQLVGHGVGREMHEPPQAPNFVNEKTLGEDFRLRPGLVLAIEPMVNIGKKEVACLDDEWTQVTADGSLSAHFEHTVALTSDGPIRLTAGPGTEADEWLGSC